MGRLLAKGASPLTTRARGLAKGASALAKCVYLVNLLWCPAIKGMIVAPSAVLGVELGFGITFFEVRNIMALGFMIMTPPLGIVDNRVSFYRRNLRI